MTQLTPYEAVSMAQQDSDRRTDARFKQLTGQLDGHREMITNLNLHVRSLTERVEALERLVDTALSNTALSNTQQQPTQQQPTLGPNSLGSGLGGTVVGFLGAAAHLPKDLQDAVRQAEAEADQALRQIPQAAKEALDRQNELSFQERAESDPLGIFSKGERQGWQEGQG